MLSQSPSKISNPNWSSTHAGQNLRNQLDAYDNGYNNMIINEFNRPSSTSVKTGVYRSKTSSIIMPTNEYGMSLEKTPAAKGMIKPSPKSIKKPPKVPRPGQKGENLINKFNDSNEGHVNESIDIDESQNKPFELIQNIPVEEETVDAPIKEEKKVQFNKFQGKLNLRDK